MSHSAERAKVRLDDALERLSRLEVGETLHNAESAAPLRKRRFRMEIRAANRAASPVCDKSENRMSSRSDQPFSFSKGESYARDRLTDRVFEGVRGSDQYRAWWVLTRTE